MKSRSLSQAKTANIVGVDQKTISNWLRGTVIPNEEKIRNIKASLGINDTPKAIFSGTDDFEKILAIRNEIQKVFDTVGNSLSEIDKILNSKKF